MRLRYPSLLLATLLAASSCTGSTDEPRTEESGPGTPAPSVTEAVTWQRLAAGPSARTEVAAATTGSRVYVVGGFRADGGTVATVEIFDTATSRWESGPDLPVAVNHPMAATVDNEVYVFGGFLANGDPGKDAFKLEGGAWRPIAQLPQERAAGTAVAQSGKVYVAGGLNAGGLARQMLVYDPASDIWTNAPGPPTPASTSAAPASAGRSTQSADGPVARATSPRSSPSTPPPTSGPCCPTCPPGGVGWPRRRPAPGRWSRSAVRRTRRSRRRKPSM
ncbi:hypothetical protein Pflav_072140 [Phytohabitans flavus]|uniref:Galactose oxidase n=1 Tax=Phytohabitans flavus TaxID=1076124 RepID=A0A6F8Y3V4_9ACTN|nr:kelch repeat-containing protein [Phytohabitans flavus]BCB80804.1 hypothetical protein Pflav_072140 [Phytohabitans flavus]